MVREVGRLSARERQVAVLVREGLTDREIAEKLFITRRTAEWHVEQILGKLGLTSRAQIAAQIAHDEASGSLPAEETVRHNLPIQATSFIGRESQLGELGRLLVTVRLLTLTGVPGVGKTRLAMEVARRLMSAFPDGICFVDLAAVHEGALVARAVASALWVRERPRQGLDQSVIRHLTNRRLLLILDNCDHVIQPAASLADLILRNCPAPTLLATSRELLRIPGELNWRVPPLTVPESNSAIDGPSRFEAVDLFLERAQQVAPSFNPADQKGSVAALCRQLDGIPLAIELAAARANLMSAADMLGRLAGRFKLLAAGNRTAADRHQTMEAAVDWSHELLSGDERKLFRRLSVFAGTFSLESIEVVCPGDDLDASTILGLLAKLVDKSLVVPIGEARGRIRYRLLETLRQYGHERMETSGETAQIQRAHFWHFLELAQSAAPRLWTDMEPLERLDDEQDNLRLAFSRAESTDPDNALRLAVALWPYWNTRGRLIEGRESFDKALRHGGGDPVLRCEALSLVGQFAWYSADEAAMAEYAEQAVTLGRTIPASHGLTRGLVIAGACAFARQEFDLAERLFRESIATAGAMQPQYAGSAGTANVAAFAAMCGLLDLKMCEGDLSGGRRAFKELHEMFDEAHFPLQHCILQFGMAMEECIAGDYVRACDHLRRGLPLARRFGINYWGGVGVRASSYVAAWRHAFEDSMRLLGASQALRDQVPFSPRGFARSADYLLEGARAVLSSERAATLVDEGERISPSDAFDLALAAVSDSPTEVHA